MHAEEEHKISLHKSNTCAVYVPGRYRLLESERGISEQFEVGNGIPQGSASSPFLFTVLAHTLYQQVLSELPSELHCTEMT